MFSLMNERERERKREREWGIERKAKKLKGKTEEPACSETPMKFSIDSLRSKFLHLSTLLSLRVT